MTSIIKRPAALSAVSVAATLVVAGSAWWAVQGSKPVSQQHTNVFVGKVVGANTGAEEATFAEGWACIRPNVGEVSGAGENWCGPVYPSGGLYMAGLTAGLEVRVLAFDATGRIPDGSSVALRGALVVPASAPIPGSGQPSTTTVPNQAATEAFAPHLVGLTEADATTAANSLGFLARTVSVDGRKSGIHADLRANRINLVIVNGVVTRADVG